MWLLRSSWIRVMTLELTAGPWAFSSLSSWLAGKHLCFNACVSCFHGSALVGQIPKQWKHWPCGDFGFQLMLWVWDRLIIYTSNGKCLEASFAVPFASASGAEITHSTFKEHRFPRHELAWPSLCFCQNALHHLQHPFCKGQGSLDQSKWSSSVRLAVMALTVNSIASSFRQQHHSNIVFRMGLRNNKLDKIIMM